MPYNYAPVGPNFWVPLDVEKRNQLRAECMADVHQKWYWVVVNLPEDKWEPRFSAIARMQSYGNKPENDYFQFYHGPHGIPATKITHVALCPFPEPPPLEKTDVAA